MYRCILFVAAEPEPSDPAAVEAGFEMQLTDGQQEQYDSQFQESAPPAITGTHIVLPLQLKKTKLHGLSPRANYTDRVTATCWRSDCQRLRIEGATWSA
jgi:hypothetical protein